MNTDKITTEIQVFENTILMMTGSPFKSFNDCMPFQDTEGYKINIYNDAKQQLLSTKWKPDLIGSGKIKRFVVNACIQKTVYNYRTTPNNLVFWTQVDNFKKKRNSKELELELFNFYKSKNKDSISFDTLCYDHDLPYQLLAYLFFIKNNNRFLPISQERFDDIFKYLDVDLKTSHNVSWNNYSNFIDVIKQIRRILKEKDNHTTLLDAHSFLWIIGLSLFDEDSVWFKVRSELSTRKQALRNNAWSRLLTNTDTNTNTNTDTGKNTGTDDYNDVIDPHEVEENQLLIEGAKKVIVVNRYERSAKARSECIKYYGFACQVCGFKFYEVYGDIGKEYIHVHHITPLHILDTTYTIDPIKDLIPLCPNCHCMIHRRKEQPYTIQELRDIIQKNRPTPRPASTGAGEFGID